MGHIATIVLMSFWWTLLVWGANNSDALTSKHQPKPSLLRPSGNNDIGKSSGDLLHANAIGGFHSTKSNSSEMGSEETLMSSPNSNKTRRSPTSVKSQDIRPTAQKHLPPHGSTHPLRDNAVFPSLTQRKMPENDQRDAFGNLRPRPPPLQTSQETLTMFSEENTKMRSNFDSRSRESDFIQQHISLDNRKNDDVIDPTALLDSKNEIEQEGTNLKRQQMLESKLSEVRHASSAKMGGHTHKRDTSLEPKKFVLRRSFENYKNITKFNRSQLMMSKNNGSVNSDQSSTRSIVFSDSATSDPLTPANDNNWDRHPPESPIKTTIKPHFMAYHSSLIDPANDATSNNPISMQISPIIASDRNAQHVTFNGDGGQTIISLSNETEADQNTSVGMHSVGMQVLMANESQQRTKVVNFDALNEHFAPSGMISFPSITFSHRLHQSFSARNSEPQTYQIDSSPFSYGAKYGMGVKTFNLPPPPPVFSHPSSDHHSSHRYPSPFGPPVSTPLPSFDTATPTNISAQHGSNTFLLCKIRNLSNQSVSWIRSRDSHIISVDSMTFIADERFHVFHDPDTGSWSLQIKYVQARDDGTYECQVSSEPKISHFVHFTVVTPLVRIPGGADIHVQLGETVTLKCVISAALRHPSYVFWYQKGQRVGSGSGLGGGRRVTEERISSDTTVATLLIPQASAADAGLYTCSPAALPTAAITLHVINGEHPAAMQHGTSVTSCQASRLLLLSVLTLLWLSTSSLLALDRRPRPFPGTSRNCPRAMQVEGIQEGSQGQRSTSGRASIWRSTRGNRNGGGSVRCFAKSNSIYFAVEEKPTECSEHANKITTIDRELEIDLLGLIKDKKTWSQAIPENSNEKADQRCQNESKQYGRFKVTTVVQEHEARKVLEIIQPKPEQFRNHPIIVLKYFEHGNSLQIRYISDWVLFKEKSSSILINRPSGKTL